MILLSAGHYPAARGACYHDVCEHSEAVTWVEVTANLLRGRQQVAIVPTGPLDEKVRWINQQPNVSLICEIHFNSDESRKQHGSETLYCPGSKIGAVLGGIVQAELAGVFPPSRGAKEGWYRMDRPGHKDYPGDVEGDEVPDYILQHTRPYALIVEPEFIYNYHLIEERRHAGCAALADGLHRAAQSLQAGE